MIGLALEDYLQNLPRAVRASSTSFLSSFPNSKPSSPKSFVAKLSLSSQPTSSSSFNALRKSFPSQTLHSISSPSCFLVRPFAHLAWIQTDRKSGGLGDLKYPLVSDVTKSISKSCDVLIRIRVSH